MITMIIRYNYPKNKVKELHLHGNNLKQLPESIRKLINIEIYLSS